MLAVELSGLCERGHWSREFLSDVLLLLQPQTAGLLKSETHTTLIPPNNVRLGQPIYFASSEAQ